MTPQDATRLLHKLLQEPQDGQTPADIRGIDDCLKAGADVTAADAEGVTPLLRCLGWPAGEALFNNRAQTALALMLEKSDLAARRPDGQSVDDLAAARADSGRAVTMLERERYRRADPDLARMVRHIPMDWPMPGLPADDNTPREFFAACLGSDTAKTYYYLHLFPQAAQWRQGSLTPLMALAGGGGSLERRVIAEKMIALGCDVNAQDDDGMTALMYACQLAHGCYLMIEPLVMAGADEHLRDRQGRTAADYAEGETSARVTGELQHVLRQRRLRDDQQRDAARADSQKRVDQRKQNLPRRRYKL